MLDVHRQSAGREVYTDTIWQVNSLFRNADRGKSSAIPSLDIQMRARKSEHSMPSTKRGNTFVHGCGKSAKIDHDFEDDWHSWYVPFLKPLVQSKFDKDAHTIQKEFIITCKYTEIFIIITIIIIIEIHTH